MIAAVLSHVIRDGRGARWKDIHNLLRWFNRADSILGKQWLHTRAYDRVTLEEQAKYHLNKYRDYVEERKKYYFS